MKKITFALLITAILFSATACKDKKTVKIVGERKSEVSSPRSKAKTIGFSIDTLAIERWQRDLDVFMNRVKEMGANVIVQNAGNSIDEQNRQLMYLLDQNVDVVVVLPKQNDAISESIQKIKNKNIPVISYDRLTRNADIDLYITIDSERVGEIMADGLLHVAKNNNWYCILGAKEDYNMTLITAGIYTVIKNTPVKIGHTFYTSGWNYDLAYQEMVRLLSEDKLPDAIICGNDAIADSVLSAINRYYPEKHIPICGQDADIAACQNIINGKQDFTVYKPITQLAELAAEYSVRLANGEPLESIVKNPGSIENGYKNVPAVMLEPKYVNKNNIDEVIIDSGFHTKSEVYK